MSFITIGVKLAVIMIITLSDGAPIEDESKLADIGKESFLPQLKANVEGNFAKFMEKTAGEAFLNLKLYRIKTSDSDKSNIMKIFSPRKQNKFSVSVQWPKNEQTTSSDIVDLVKMDATTPSDDVPVNNVQMNDDFQDVSLVHDPTLLGMELTNDMKNFETSTNLPWTDAKESEEFFITERTLDEESKTTEARVSMINQEDLSETKFEPTSLSTEIPVTESATDEVNADEKDESSTQGSITEKEQNTTELSKENTQPSVTTEEPNQEISTQEVSTTSAEPEENLVPEEIHVQITPKEWFAFEAVDSSKEENEEAIIAITEEPTQENVSIKITAPIKRSTNPKLAVEPPKRGIFHLFPNAVTTTKKEMHGKPLKESTEKHSEVNHQKPATKRQPPSDAEKPSEKPTNAATVPTTIETTEKETRVGLSVEGSRTDARQSEVQVEENDHTTETSKSAHQNDQRPTESVNTQVPEVTPSKTVNVGLELTTTEAEISKPTEPSTPKDSIVGSVQEQVVATITEENSSPVTGLPLAAQATTSEMTTTTEAEIAKSTEPSTQKDSIVGTVQEQVVATITEENSSPVTGLPLAAQTTTSEMTTTTEAEISKSTDPITRKDSIVGTVQEQVVATITEENSSPVTGLPLAAQATTSEMTTTTEAEISKSTEPITQKVSIVGTVQVPVVATITEENSSPVTELPLVAQATKSEMTTVSTIESKPVTTVDSSLKNEAITTTTTTETSSTQKSAHLDSTTVKTTMKPTVKTSNKKPEATKSNIELLFSSFPNTNANSASHPLLSRIILPTPLRPMQMPIFMQRNVNRNANRNANPLLGSPVFRRRKHVKRSAARIDDEDRIFVTPKPFGRLPCSPGEQLLGATQEATKRPTLLQRYRDMDSVEKAETKKVVVEKIMHGVNIAGHIDGYITNTVKSGVAAIHRALNGEK